MEKVHIKAFYMQWRLGIVQLQCLQYGKYKWFVALVQSGEIDLVDPKKDQWSVVQYSVVHYSLVHYCLVQYSAVQYSVVQ